MWLTIEISAATLTFFILFQVARTLRSDWLTIFLLFALWLRYVMAALDDYTFLRIVGGSSLIAMSSILVISLGCLLVPLAFMTQRRLVPVYTIIAWTLFSGFINNEVNGAITDLLKWLYFIVIISLLSRMFLLYGLDGGLRLILVTLSTPMLLQFASIVTSTPTLGEDGLYNYIGGYFHEAVFSLVVMTTMWIATLVRWKRAWWGNLLVVACFLGIVVANYRTMIIAALPILVIFGWSRGQHSRETGWRTIALLIAISLGVVTAALSPEVQTRFDDLLFALGNVDNLIKPAAEYNQLQRELLSTRFYLWAQYIGAFADADITNKLIGFGPQSHNDTFFTHPHNMFIYALYETGIFGLVFLLAMLVRNMVVAFKVVDTKIRWLVLAGHFAFLLANLATSPLSEIEGLIFYAVLCAATWHGAATPKLDRRNIRRRTVTRRATPPRFSGRTKHASAPKWQGEPCRMTPQIVGSRDLVPP